MKKQILLVLFVVSQISSVHAVVGAATLIAATVSAASHAMLKIGRNTAVKNAQAAMNAYAQIAKDPVAIKDGRAAIVGPRITAWQEILKNTDHEVQKYRTLLYAGGSFTTLLLCHTIGIPYDLLSSNGYSANEAKDDLFMILSGTAVGLTALDAVFLHPMQIEAADKIAGQADEAMNIAGGNVNRVVFGEGHKIG